MPKKIKFEFEYDLPDEYLSEQATLGLKAKGIYEGPEQIWVLVNKDTGNIQFNYGYVEVEPRDPAVAEAVAQAKAGQNFVAVLVNAKDEPVVAGFYVDLHPDTYTVKEYKLADGSVHYARPDPTYPDHTYEVGAITYNLESKSWNKPFPFKKPHITAEQHEGARLAVLEGYKRDLADEFNDYTPEMRKAIEAAIKELEAIPETHGHLDPWQIPFPNDPRAEPLPTPPADQTQKPDEPNPSDHKD